MSSADFNPEDAFNQAFDDELDTYPPDTDWLITGRASAAHPHGEDEDWWREHGPQHVAAWVKWRARTNWTTWVTPDGVPGIELPIEVEINGELIKMFVDWVAATGPNNTRPIAVDVKSGAKEPDWYFQLGIYKLGIEAKWPGVKVNGGAYWMARKGEVSGVVGLNHFTPEYLGVAARRVREMRDRGLYLPSVGSQCKSCSVGRFCAANNGAEAHLDPDYHLLGGTQ